MYFKQATTQMGAQILSLGGKAISCFILEMSLNFLFKAEGVTSTP